MDFAVVCAVHVYDPYSGGSACVLGGVLPREGWVWEGATGARCWQDEGLSIACRWTVTGESTQEEGR